MEQNNENIFFSITDNIDKNINEIDNNKIISDELNNILNELENNNLKISFNYNENENIAKIINYTLNYKLKDLYLICEYYNIIKEIKQNKCNKEEIINIIVNFENNINNSEIVFKRMNMWFYINELKNDKFMKKFVLF